MKIDHFQEEETYLFSSLLNKLKGLSEKNGSITTKCLLAIFWRLHGEKQFIDPLLRDIETEIDAYNSDPSRESNRIKKVFACAAYKAAAKKPKHEEKIQNYLSYARDSKDWLGQPRIACCLTFLGNDPIAEEARAYLRENLGTWLSEGKHDFIAVALSALRAEISTGDLQRIVERVESDIDNLSLGTISMYLAGFSHSNAGLPNKDAHEDRLYESIRDRVKATPSLEDDETIRLRPHYSSQSIIESQGILRNIQQNSRRPLLRRTASLRPQRKPKPGIFCYALPLLPP